MQEIRLRWSKGIERSPSDAIQATPGAGLWFPDSPEVRISLEIIRSCGDEAFGDGTHWIEERQA